ncbi:xanthine dehydrogenase family protein molybdopterin-binding subunit [Parasphingorhabdus cellanae]|uniref:Xanthine dehydrogenase family protein molybdopterin-binding subunit n=1 Tax=Parasphingorhabdus cellanae TaxID=2806553 RepID=A0ABX7T342_9SPHN|nr:molybdopterin cofactor-binding domain-containing protein [Parasphingorhabdus cellanae]QTD55368.1 xanthine dehydrogenase family protein molybdopterin-binding subunit [Parasphingorhabdus cellanae]
MPIEPETEAEREEDEKTARLFTRRNFLIGGSAATGLVLAWAIWPRAYEPNISAAENEEIFGAYLKISKEGQVTVVVPQSEMGQGVYTILPQILADELGADWRTIAVEPAPINPLYANGFLAQQWAETLLPPGVGKLTEEEMATWMAKNVATRNDFIVTADSASVPAYASSFREAGAAARVLLSKAAGAKWDVGWESCIVENGFVSNGEKKLRFGELVGDALEQDLPDPVPLRSNPVNNLVGQDVPRLDLPSKLDGSANFAGDIRLPDLVYASIRQGPIGATRLKSFNREGAGKIIGLVEVVEHDRWIAAVATNWWAANQALDQMSPMFETTGLLPDSDTVDLALENALSDGPGTRFASRGETKPAFDEFENFQAIYQVEAALHAPVETRTATAEYRDGRLELWLATQAPAAAVQAAAEAAGINADNVTLYPMLAGGSFGRNLDSKIASQVAFIAKKMARPVQLIWSRAEEMMHDHYRPPTAARLNAATDKVGRIQALQIKVAAPAAAREQSKRVVQGMDEIEAMRASIGEADAKAVSGADVQYNIANFTLDHHPAYMGAPTGNWRSNADSYNAFFVESFIDELAARAKIEPLSYRMQLMSGRPRLARCLTGVAAMAGWDGGLDGSGQGLACHSMRGGHIAVIVSANRGESGLRVRRISATVDIGRIIHPDIARQQIEGGIVFGLSMALGSATRFHKGLPLARRMSDLSLPRLAEIPPIQIEFIRSEEDPVGVEEIGVPAVAPAVANALFSATGTRFRQLPLFAEVS